MNKMVVELKQNFFNDLAIIKDVLIPILSLSRSAVLVENTDSIVMLANQEFCSVLDKNLLPEDILGLSTIELSEKFNDFFPSHEIYFDRIKKIKNEQKSVVNERVNLKDNLYFKRDYRPLFHNGKLIAHYWQFYDISESVEFQNKLELSLLHKTKYNKLNKNLMSIASHELRTPLTSIKSTVDLILSSSNFQSGERLVDKLNRIKRASDSMNQLLDDIMSLGVLENYELKGSDINVVSLKEILEIVNEIKEECLPDRNLVIKSNEDDVKTYRINKNSLYVAIKNILINSHKYSDINKPIYIGLEERNDSLIITVKDEGIGIPKGEIKRIQGLFERASNVKNIKGSGLGLAITKRVMEIMVGELQIKSKEGIGTEVSLILNSV